MKQMCQHVDIISDDAFGFWDDVWGPPDVHIFRCDEPATVVVNTYTPEGDEQVHLCAEHAQAEQDTCTMIRASGLPCGAPAVVSRKSMGEINHFCADCAKWGL